jgi:hypothetical protein
MYTFPLGVVCENVAPGAQALACIESSFFLGTINWPEAAPVADMSSIKRTDRLCIQLVFQHDARLFEIA